MVNRLVNLKGILIVTAASVTLALSSSNAPASAFVSDDFSSGTLNSELWTFVNPLVDSTAVVVGQVLQISVPEAVQHRFYPPEKNGVRVMQAVDDTDFEVEVKFDSAPSQQYQEQGLMVDQDADNYLTFEVYSDGSTVNALVRNVAGGGITFPVGASLTAAQAHYYLRVGRVGNDWTFKYSYDGVAWVTAGTLTRSMTVGGIGVYAANESGATSPAFTALVDYVFNTASPIVPGPPQITVQPTNVTVTEPSAASFSVTATGAAPLAYQWRRGGVNIGGATNSSYTLSPTSVAADNGAQFSVVVTNAQGSVTSAVATLTVNAPAAAFVSDDFSSGTLNPGLWTFVNPLSDSTAVVVGQVLQISVPGEAQHRFYPPEKNGVRVMQAVGDTDFEVEVKFDSAPSQQYQEQGLLVDQDADNYLAYEVYSDGTTVNALVRNIAGGGITFPVAASLTAAQAHYYLRVGRVGNDWTFKYSYDGVGWVTAGTLTQSMTVGGIGVYAANESGGTSPAFTALVDYVFNTASPIVPGPPQITVQPTNVTVTEPSAASFSVTATGAAPLAYQWRRGGVNIGGATNSSYTLSPTSVAADNGAQFRVVVTNAQGSVTSAVATLTVNAGVLETPQITVPPASTTVVEPNVASFSVTATGTAPLAYQWRRGGMNIVGATGSSYSLNPTAVAADNGAQFTVVVTNAAGSVTSAVATLTVKPNIPVILTSGTSWTNPAGVMAIMVEAWGGGGGGGGDNSGSNTGAGGGGGGAYARVNDFAVTPGAVYSYTIGAAGAEGNKPNGSGGDGGNTFFNTSTCIAAGGKGGGGGDSGSGGLGGSASVSTGDVTFDGGNGAQGGTYGGGGGGSGGSASAGNNGVNTVPPNGATAVTDGGPGGGGGDGDAGSAPESGPGGGGGGGDKNSSNVKGGAGHAGQIKITYIFSPIVPEQPSVLSIVNNGDHSVTVTFAGTAGAEYLVQATPDLTSPVSWANVSTNTASPGGQWTYTVNDVTTYPHQFLRAAKP